MAGGKLKESPPQENVEIQRQQFESNSFQQQSMISTTATQQVLNSSFEVSSSNKAIWFMTAVMLLLCGPAECISLCLNTLLPAPLGTSPKKKRENVGILRKQGGGVYLNPTSIFFTVFNMGDLPKINGKIGKKFPNRGEGGGGVPDIFPVFFGNVP